MVDRRHFIRYSCRDVCEIRINNKVYKGVVVNRSDGLGVIIGKAPLFKKGSLAEIRLINLNTEMEGQVAWAKEIGEDVRVGFNRVGGLKGNLKNFKLADLFIGIQRGTKTGVLEIVNGSIIKRVYIRNGDIIFADSSFQGDRFGEMLVREGKITIEEFNLASERLLETGEELGKILVDMSCMTPRELYHAVQRQVEEIILGLFAITDAEFEFKEGPLPSNELSTFIISAANIIYRGIKRIQSLTFVKEMSPPPEAVLDLSRDPMDIFQSISLDPADKEILYLIDGSYTLEEILSLSPLTDVEILKTISALFRIGIITIKKGDEASEMIAARDLLEGHVDENGDEFLTKVEELYAQCESADYYNFFGINSKATGEEIQKAYYRISKQFHPDQHFIFPKHDVKGKLIKIFTYATEANTILSDPEKRYIYDEALLLKAQNISNGEETGQASHENAGATKEEPLQKVDYNSMDSVISDFKEGSEEPESFETHYELGLAYIEMGLVEDAIKEFRITSNDPLRKIKSCKVIAECYMNKGDYQNAIEELKKLMSELSDDQKEYQDVKYTLADVYKKNGEYDNALKLYNEIQSQDAGYRDVAKQVEALSDIPETSSFD